VQIFDPRILLAATVLAPGCAFLLMAAAWLSGIHLREKATLRLAGATYGLASLFASGLIVSMVPNGVGSVSAGSGSLYAVHQFNIPLVLFADRLSLPLLSLTVLLVGLIALFSKRYLHRDPHFNRFFLLLHLFAFGALLLFTAGSFDLLIAGWELVGITSVLLIAFFYERREPVQSSIRVFVTYRLCDIGLITGAFALHHITDSTSYGFLFSGTWPDQNVDLSSGGASVIGLLFLLAAMGKSAQAPFSGWLPRAMEGPTPSSAIFYGAISIHAGAYLLLRAQPILEASPIAAAVVIAIGAWSAIHGTMVARVCADAKTSLAYSAISQLGLIFVEIGLGLYWLALIHIVGHALVRMLQLLKAPSLLHEFHGVHAAAGGHLGKTGAMYEKLLPAPLRTWLYRLALDRGHHDTIIDRFLAGPLKRFATRLTAVEERWTSPGEKQSEREGAWLS
jgi:NADH-quinone oxidoreductase subunit L